MKNCKKCVWCRYCLDLNSDKIFKCKFLSKGFNYPEIHGLFCKRYANKIVEQKKKN